LPFIQKKAKKTADFLIFVRYSSKRDVGVGIVFGTGLEA
jgi:hypothetical protein